MWTDGERQDDLSLIPSRSKRWHDVQDDDWPAGQGTVLRAGSAGALAARRCFLTISAATTSVRAVVSSRS